jgi:hypothetical protein
MFLDDIAFAIARAVIRKPKFLFDAPGGPAVINHI